MSYPGTIDSFTPKTDAVDDVMAADINELQTAITAVETELGTDPAGTETDVAARLAHSLSPAGMLEVDPPASLTITGGIVTVAQTYNILDTEGSAASDDLHSINGGTDGMFIVIRGANPARAIVVKHDDGNIWCRTGADITLSHYYDWAWGIWDDSYSMWLIQ